MIKFVHKKHLHTNRPEAKFVIYYSVSDIVLGSLLIFFVGFFVVSYLRSNLYSMWQFNRANMNSIPASYGARAE